MEGARFGELKLEVGMKFNSKYDFIEVVREFTIREGRQINFRRNESYRLASKLVKKIRKYPNLKHGEASDYFKRKCDLDLNKSSLARALSDARNIRLIPAVRELMPGVHHRFCVWHL
ncbi:hypothetical protein Ahy_B08g092260 [Arachis hypogaea]|uniref:Uncharacterized protein n=1 Tax=Arachis hypogaea TaxID=3818 RepID=A0A444Y3K9_ARAHY|nr:hypothetical protein Ahy_B08g092260 [Arachis hypogaea]